MECQIVAPLARPRAEQARQFRIGAELVLEHRSVVGGKQGVASREQACPTPGNDVAIAAAGELTELDAYRQPRLEPVGPSRSALGHKLGAGAPMAHKWQQAGLCGRGEETCPYEPAAVRNRKHRCRRVPASECT